MNLRCALAASGILALITVPAWASHKIYSPIVEEGVFEVEMRGDRTVDASPDKDDGQKDIYELSYGVNSWWTTGVLAELSKEPGEGFRYEATAWENVFQLAAQGEYWIDTGLYFEYAKAAITGEPDEIEGKLLLEKAVHPLVLTANLILTRDIGDNAADSFGFEYGVRANYPWSREIQFGIEAYGEPGRLSGFNTLAEQEHSIGPVLSGKFNVGSVPGVFVYNIGYLFGLTDTSPSGTAKWQLEYEISL